MKNIKALAKQYITLDKERLELVRKTRTVVSELDRIRAILLKVVEKPTRFDVPLTQLVDGYFVTQILRHRKVEGYEYDFTEFKIVPKSAKVP